MGKEEKTRQELLLEIEELRARLEEAEETLRAIRSGEVDAVIVSGPQGEQVYTLKGADHTYRLLIEQMKEGAATLAAEGTILYCNRRLG
ncbi:MAG: hybrid sensor histidine kinase/response regulator, partial [Anaerolineae bacterium]|nr:hybrid sensor histidine kinase/response regulator [Anaerolineae bacterium]NIQ78568.1 hybrid sensor histidine kinase/response regulator [Anaerolineae bacterium]